MSATWKRFSDWVDTRTGAKFMAVWMTVVMTVGIYSDASLFWTATNAALVVYWTIDAIRP